MLAADFQTLPLHAIGRSILGLRHAHHRDEAAEEIDAFQNKVAHLFLDLAPSNSYSSGEILSLPWLRCLLEVFVICQEEFRVLLLNNKACLANPPLERLIGDFYERSVKALDVCNAIRDGIEQIRQWKKLLEIVFDAIDSGKYRRKNCQKSLGEGQIRRAKKALADLSVGISLGRINQASKEHKSLRKSLSWSVSRSWSASRQIHAIGCNLSPPKGSDVSTTNGLTAAVYTMNCVLYIVMWALVAAIPCHDRGLEYYLSIPRYFVWAAPILSIHDRIVEVSKKRERKHTCGLLKEIYRVERWVREMNRVTDSCLEFPIIGEKEAGVRNKVEEIHEVYEGLKKGLEPLERQIRLAFHGIVRSRMQGLDCLGGSCDCKNKRQTHF
ncbi:hypothetical protein V2J09_005790 [Rumex salicifolius]